jgi:hypothetical protein
VRAPEDEDDDKEEVSEDDVAGSAAPQPEYDSVGAYASWCWLGSPHPV